MLTTVKSWCKVILCGSTPDYFNSFDRISCPGQVQDEKGIEETNNIELTCQSEGTEHSISVTLSIIMPRIILIITRKLEAQENKMFQSNGKYF
jgi:hypothetical protein